MQARRCLKFIDHLCRGGRRANYFLKALKVWSMKDYIPKLLQITLFAIIVLFVSCFARYAGESRLPSDSPKDDVLAGIVNPFDSTCYDWRGNIIPCDYKRQYAELMFDKPIPDPRFMDNKDGTVTDHLTGLIWLKNAECFGMMDWESARQAAKQLKDGDCGPDPALILSDGSSAGDWRLPTMDELSALIDYSRRNPALPPGQVFSDFPPGYYWSATLLDYHPQIAWIVYFESGTTCYEAIKNNAGHIWPVRRPKE